MALLPINTRQRLRTPQFGAILRRTSDLIGDQGSDVFDRLGIPFDGRKTSILLTLHGHGPLSSTEIAAHIGHSRQLVEARLKQLVAEEFLINYGDPEDVRRRLYDFAEQSRPTVQRVVAVMAEFEAVYVALWQEVGVDIEKALLAMEAAIRRRSLTDRLLEQSPEQAAQAVEYQYD
jgi:DNA-binding MarR family transcriptional regulator